MEVLTSPYRTEFLQAIKNENEELKSHGTWEFFWRDAVPEVTDANDNKSKPKVLQGTWVYKLKRFPSGLLSKVKARFCARGNLQHDVDVYDTYAPVTSW